MFHYHFETDKDREHALQTLTRAGYKQIGNVFYRDADGLCTRVILGTSIVTIEQHCTFDMDAYNETIERQMIPIV